MKTFKQLDVYINILLLAVFMIWFIFNQGIWVVAYFVTGAWQVVSMIAHQSAGWFIKKGSSRNIHHLISVICICSMVFGYLSFAVPLLDALSALGFVIFFIMAILAPILAINYAVICYREVQLLKQNHALSLK